AQFAICIPAAETVVTTSAAGRDAPARAGDGRLILAVDDEEYILVAVKAALEDAGYRVLTAHDGAEALELLRAHHGSVSAAIVDMMMPGMDGAAAIRALRSVDSRLCIIANSGLRVSEEASEIVANCTQAFLPKPYSDEQLLTTLAQALQSESHGSETLA